MKKPSSFVRRHRQCGIRILECGRQQIVLCIVPCGICHAHKNHHQVGTHKGVVALYGQHYVKTGIMTQAEGRIYSQLQSMREKADYNCVFETAEASSR